MIKVVLFNGAPRSGKDSSSEALVTSPASKGWLVVEAKFAHALKQAAHELLGLGHLDPEHFDKVKDEPLPEFFGLSPRQFYIALSEKFMKPTINLEQVFGEVLMRKLEHFVNTKAQVRDANNVLFAISDSGFAMEAVPVGQEFGWENILLVRCHREGCTFMNDSRSYIELPCTSIDLYNDGTLEEWHDKVRRVVWEWVG